MEKLGFTNVNSFSIDEEFDIGVYTIGDADYAFLGGAFCAEGVRNYLRPLDKVKETLRAKKDWHSNRYERSRNDVIYYMDNRNMCKCNEVIKELRYDMNCQKW